MCCALAAVAAAFVGGCGPIWSAAIIVDATGKFRTARDMDAKQYSPYEYYAAEEYLHKAREKESYAQYEQAVDYAKLALAYSKAAIEKSQHAKSGLVPAGPHPGLQSIFGGQAPAQQPAPQTPSPLFAPPQAVPPAQYTPPPAPPAYTPPQYAPPAPPSEYNNYQPPAPPAPQQPTF